MKLLLIMNTPPPYWGTTIMNQILLDTLQEKDMEYIHLKIETARDLHSLGKFDFNKLQSAFAILKAIFLHRKDYRTAYLVMSVEGFAFLRHTVFILLLFLLKKKCILHLRALGFRNKKGLGRTFTRFMFRKSYLIQHSPYNSFDIESYKSKGVFYIPNGWHDYYQKFQMQVESRISRSSRNVNIVFLSNLIADKGLFTVAESILSISVDPLYKNLDIKWNFIGNWENEGTKIKFLDYISTNNLDSYIGYIGPLYNDEKYAMLSRMDILAFPTYYKHETWGNVILEAMIFKIPVIATKYVAIPEMVKDNETGFLINSKDSETLAERIRLLIDDPELRKNMGCAGRNLYLQKFKLDTFKTNILQVIQTIDNDTCFHLNKRPQKIKIYD